MKTFSKILVIFLFFLTNLSAEEFTFGNLKIIDPYIMETPKNAKVAGGYLKIINTDNKQDILISLKAGFAKISEIHEIKMVNDVMKMKKVEEGLIIPANNYVELKHGSNHIMFMNISKQMIAGEKYKVILNFERTGSLSILFPVKKMQY
tara:strand:+ start:43 stop:489 length:447 start_codon:yes stop_codon:yes gene_type:complete